MQQHPFLQRFQTGTRTLPSQVVPLKVKMKPKWQEENLDVLENIGYFQILEKRKLGKNYRIANGELVLSDYINKDDGDWDSDEFDMLEYMKSEMTDLDYTFMRNYDIISQPFNTLLNEFDNLPDVFSVIGRGDIFQNEKDKARLEMIKEWYTDLIETQIHERLAQEELVDEQQLQERYEYHKSVLNPEGIEKFMKSYKHIVELWGEYEIKDQFERFSLKDVRKEEYHHLLCVAQRFRELYVDKKGLNVRALNPLYTFANKSADEKFVQNGDYAGYFKMVTAPFLIDNFSHKLTEKQLRSLDGGNTDYEYRDKDGNYAKALVGGPVNYLNPDGLKYGSENFTPSANFNNYAPWMKNMPTGAAHALFTPEEMGKMDGGTGESSWYNSVYMLTTAYWVSQEKIGLLKWINPVTGIPEAIIVDENFIVPKWIKQIETEVHTDEINTIVWTRRKQIWQGKKISNFIGNNKSTLDAPIYFDISPAEIQIGKLPIGGQYINNINTTSKGFIDKVYHYQFIYNIVMNQAIKYLTTEILPFLVMEMNMLPNKKDWTGENAIFDWLGIGSERGIVPVDTSQSNMGGVNQSGGQFPRPVDLDRSARIITRFEIAERIRMLALTTAGISPQRLSDIKSNETATGVNEAVQRSYVQTAGWSSDYFSCEKHMLQMQLDAAKYLQSNNKDISVSYVKSDLTIQALKINKDLSLYDLHIYVVNNNEEQRNLNLARQLALQNNTSDMTMSSRILLGTSNSIVEIITALKADEERVAQERAQEFQLQKEQIESNENLSQEQKQIELQMFYDKLENELKVATIKAMGFPGGNTDNDGDNIADVINYTNTLLSNQTQRDVATAKLDFEKDKERTRQTESLRQQQFDREKHRREMQLENKKLQRDKIRGDKSK